MKKLALLTVALLLSACGERPSVLSYEQLSNYPKDCGKKSSQLAELKNIQAYKNFLQDPDSLNEEDRAYNSKLKATIWWYTVTCNNEKLTVSYTAD